MLLNPKRDKVWVDPKLGGAYRHRELYSETQGGEEVLICRYECSDFVEIASIWVPMKCTQIDFAPRNSPPNYWNKAQMELQIDVKTVSINQVTDADFNITAVPGTYLVDKKGALQGQGDKSFSLNELADLMKLKEKPT